MSNAAKNSLTRNPHFTAAGLRSAQSPGQQKVEPHRRAALDRRADFWQHARPVRCGGVRPKVRGPGSNPRPLRLSPPLLVLTSGVRVEAAASTRSCFSNPRDPAYLSNPGSLTLEPTGQRIRRLTGPRRQSLRRLGLEPVILPHLVGAIGGPPGPTRWRAGGRHAHPRSRLADDPFGGRPPSTAAAVAASSARRGRGARRADARRAHAGRQRGLDLGGWSARVSYHVSGVHGIAGAAQFSSNSSSPS